MPDELLTPAQVARLLGVTPRTVQRWAASGRLPAVRVGGRLRLSRSSLGETTVGPSRAIGRLLIANRGEIAVRIARTAIRLGIAAIGINVPGERAPTGMAETLLVPSYLDGTAILEAAGRAAADAIHPGYGFLSENQAFAAAVVEAGIRWVGPPAAAIEAIGDKAAARRRAAALGIPVVPGYDGPAQDDATLADRARELGFPLLIKPAAGGGGKGMRVVAGAGELADAIAGARREAARAFGDDRLILERLVPGPRHVEIQVLFDAHGNGVHLGERDCSTQRRSQKIVEESPAPSVSPELRERMGAAALRLAGDVGYVGAGTVEFLLADDGSFYFLEMNTRLQVEHPVTELVTGRDLVEDQLRIAEGAPLTIAQRDVRWTGHAIEARLYAEDPEAGFLPATGRIVDLRWPDGDGVRVDTGLQAGDEVSDRFDPMLAKVIVHGRDRRDALDRLRRALDETRVLGVRTNLRLLRHLVAEGPFAAGEMRTDTLASMPLLAEPQIPADAWAAASRALLAEGPYGAGPWGGGWRPNAPAAVRLASGETERRVALVPEDGADRQSSPPLVLSGGVSHVDVEGRSVEIRLAMPPSIEDAVRHAATAEGHASLTAPMPGRVVSVRAAVGDRVEAHAALVVIEAMKMEHAVTTPLAGSVTRLAVRAGDQVQRGDLLAEVVATS